MDEFRIGIAMKELDLATVGSILCAAILVLLMSPHASGQCLTESQGQGWANSSFASQSGAFTATWDAVGTNLGSSSSAVMGLSNGAGSAYANFAGLVAFDGGLGRITARNGSSYTADTTVAYTNGVQYHFQLDVNVATHTYSIYVTPVGGSQRTLGSNYAFRTEQSGVTALNNFGVTVDPSGPGTVQACGFGAAAPPTSVTIQTSPTGRLFSVDGGSSMTAPQTLSLSQGQHTIAVAATQAGSSGTQYVFTGWTDNVATASRTITVGATVATYTANFKTQYQLTISASYSAAGTVTPASGGFYDAGTVVPIGATTNTGYSFGGWSVNVANPSSASTSVTMNAAQTVTANFLTNITIQTSPSGLKFSVDGSASQTAPQTVSLSQSSHSIAVATPQTGSAGNRYRFDKWNDQSTQPSRFIAVTTPTTYAASFVAQYLLTAMPQPSGSGSVGFSPSGDGYYDTGTQLQLTATPSSNSWQFTNWSGDVSSTSNPLSVTTNSAFNVTANFIAANTCGLSPASASFGAGASNGNTVSVAGACGSWSVSVPQDVKWIVITGGASGNGSGTVTYNLLANPNGGTRSATLTIAGQSFLITQSGQGCLFGLTPASVSTGANGGSGTFSVTLSGADCIWSATPNAAWLSITAGSGGTGNGTVTYAVASNQASSFSRTGTISLSTSTTQTSFTVTQAGAICSYSLQQANSAFTPAGGSGSVNVSAPGGCPWTASNGLAPLVTIMAGTPGSGNGAVSYTVPANSSGAARSETLTIAGQQYTVTQAGAATASCTAATSPPPAIAMEGRTELLGELFLTCDGFGATTAAKVALTLNTSVTNALDGTNADAQLTSGASQLTGQISGYNTLLWTNVPIGPGSTTIHITNVRVDASLLGNGASLQSAGVIAQVSVNAGTDVPVSYSPQSAACSAAGPGEILGCAAPTLVFQKGQASPPTGGPQTTIPLVYQEATSSAFQAGGAGATRLRLVLTKIPSTVRVFAPVYPSEGTSHAQLLSADVNGAGGNPVAGTSISQGVYQELTVTQGTATATWVVLSANPSKIETWTFPLLLNNATNSDLNTIQIGATLGPVSDSGVASSSAPVPRYRDFSRVQKLVNLRITIVTSFTTTSSVASTAHLAATTPAAGTVKGNGTSTIQILNDTSDPNQVATGVAVNMSSSGASGVGCSTTGAGQCSTSGSSAQATFSSLQPGESETVTWTEQSDPSAQGVGTTARAAADQVSADLGAATASSFILLNGTPVPVLVDPPSGTGSTQTFTATFSHPNGWQNLGVVNILINSALDAKHACYLAYSTQYSTLLLVDDAGDAGGPFAGSIPLGSSATAQNSQCIVGLVSATPTDAKTLTLTLKITFTTAFGGNRVVYVAARDQSGNNSNWQSLGVWQAPWTPAGTISVANLNPGHSAGTSGTLQLTLTDTKGANDIGIVNVLINSALDARQACYLAYVASNNTLLLVDDAGDAGGPFAGSMALGGGSATIQNSQCQVKAFGSSAAANGSGVTLTLNLTFFAGFGGNRIVYGAGRDKASGNNTDWQPVGTWTIQ
jgi:hypothetical protein